MHCKNIQNGLLIIIYNSVEKYNKLSRVINRHTNRMKLGFLIYTRIYIQEVKQSELSLSHFCTSEDNFEPRKFVNPSAATVDQNLS